ncbi:Transcription factor MYB3R-1, partial [Mucuna pruriens]
MDGEQSMPAPSHGHVDGAQKVRALHGRTTGPARRSTKGQWTLEEDDILRKAVQRFKGKNWKKIGTECFKDRTDVQCLHRWQKVLNPELVKGPWSKEEDEIIIELVKKNGPKKWSSIAQHLPGRIGKQCRERWCNHLDPTIKKEAWTQEEELALIHFHQKHGNRWAELSKFILNLLYQQASKVATYLCFCGNRTDNAIKNHWNSSVKKKLDSYLASGLLTRFESGPHVGNSNQPTRLQCRGDDNGPKGTEGEEVSECSQGSANAVCFPSARGTSSADLPTGEAYRPKEECSLGKDHSVSRASCSEPYYVSIDDVTMCIPEIAYEEACTSQFIEQQSHEPGNSISGDCQFNLHSLPNISSMVLGQESSQLQRDCIAPSEVCDMVNVPFQNSVELGVSTSMGCASMDSLKPEHMLISDDECCRVLFSGATNDGCFPPVDYSKGEDMVEFSGCTSFLCQSCNIQISETGGTSTPQLTCPQCSDNYKVTSSSQSVLPVLSASDDRLVPTANGNQLFRTDHQFVSGTPANFTYVNDISSSPCVDGIGSAVAVLQEPHDTLEDTSKLVPVNSFGCGSDAKQTCNPIDEETNVHAEQEDSGSLCYEPPRFPSLDIPFFSCDLVQSGIDMQQEFSPLGIRQFMMSSMNCLTPFRLWDSPSRDDSPDALLKSAAKTFTGTPSILKKRHRDLLSPLSDKRIDKKLETDMTSTFTKKISSLDVMFGDNETREADMPSSSLHKQNTSASVDDDNKENCEQAYKGASSSSLQKQNNSASVDDDNKENCGQAYKGASSSSLQKQNTSSSVDDDNKENCGQAYKGASSLQKKNTSAFVDDDNKENCGQAYKGEQVDEPIKSVILDEKKSQKDTVSNSQHNVKQLPLDSKMKSDATSAEIEQQPCEVLVEHDVNDMSLSSPDQVGLKSDRGLGSSAKTPKSLNRSLEAAPNQSCHLKLSSENPRSKVNSPCVRPKEQETLSIAIPRVQAPGDNSGDQTRKDGGFETCSIFGGTPFRKGIESPSAWKSPWFFNTSLFSPREITIEDFGYLMSPGDRSYDAIGLLKQISEQTAATYANAQEILGNETPKALPKDACGNDKDKDPENNDPPNQPGNHSQLASNALIERRTLDFSECGTPGKSDNNKSLAMSFSSPTSYLMK